MGELEFTTPKTAWGGEAAAFTPALSHRLSYLGEVCGLGPLALTGTEVPVGARRIDVLATVEQRQVVIENQYGLADHDHLTRGLAYAVAQQASALVVVAERHSDEFVAVAEYLNALAGAAGDELPTVWIWLVEVQAVRRVGDDVWSPLFTVAARPNEWVPRPVGKRHFVTDIGQVIEQALDPTAAAWIVETWEHEEHTVTAVGGDVNATVQLRHPDPADPRKGHAFMTVLPKNVWVNVGYTLDSSGAFEDAADSAEFEQRLRSAFPSASSPHKDLPSYFAVEYAEITHRHTETEGFIQWLCMHLDTKMQEDGAADLVAL
jgi:hypothetical protein